MSIKVYLGCMFSGKTSELISEYKRWHNIKKNIFMINYADDNRYGDDNFVYSHDKQKVPCIKTTKLMDLHNDNQTYDILNDTDVILVNEGQFFPDLIEFCKFWCDEQNKNIVVCGLDGDYLRRPFGQMNDLITIADDVVKLKAFCKICNDGTEAIFTKRLTNSQEKILIGETDIYMPVCRKHYLQ